MNPDRQIRFLYPPTLIILFLGWAIYADPISRAKAACMLSGMPDVFKNNAGTLLVGSSAILVVGFGLGTITFIALRIIFLVFGFHTHEVPMSNGHRKVIWTTLKPVPDFDQKKVLFATAYFHFGISSKETAEWVARRWNAFNLSATICLGIALVMLLVGWSSCIHSASSCWFFTGIAGLLVFFLNAVFAWKETMGMISFCAEIQNYRHGSA